MVKDIYEVKLPQGTKVYFKLYNLLEQKGISHNRFMRETETSYDTMKRYAKGVITKPDMIVLDRWCSYLGCTFEDIISYEPYGRCKTGTGNN